MQRILNWTFTSTALAPATTCLPNTLCFPNGFKAASGLKFNGTGNSVTGSVLELTNSTFQKSSTFFAQPLPAHTFTTDFDFQFTTGNGDGFTFVAQSQGPLAIGSAGGGLGYGAENPARHTAFITQSVAVKFDLHNNAGEGGNSTGVYTNGKSPSSLASDLSASLINLHSGHTLHVRIKYEGGLLRSTITDLTDYATDTQDYISDNIYDIPYNIDLAHTYFGFTAGTGILADTVKSSTGLLRPISSGNHSSCLRTGHDIGSLRSHHVSARVHFRIRAAGPSSSVRVPFLATEKL